MKVSERAWQFWPLLVWAARNRQIISYRILNQCTGMYTPGLGKCLEPIQAYCISKGLPPLTSIVVDEDGMPGDGFTAAADVPLAQSQVFRWDWEKQRTPTPEEFETLPTAVVAAPAATITPATVASV